MKRFIHPLVAIGGGLLLWAAWPSSPFTLLIFVGWIPLLWLETKIKSRRRFFALTYLSMFTWNITTTWWIWNASPPGALAAFFANSLIMCLPWLGFKIAKKWLGETRGYIALITFWMCFEYLHLHDWGLSWPWLTLGNVFATNTSWIQWYEYTGTSGGTLWVLLVNIFLFLHIRNNMQRESQKKIYKYLITAVLLIVLPLLLSRMSFFSRTIPDNLPGVVIVQPNIDPYEKIATGSFEAQLQKLIHTSEQQIDDNTGLVVWPETALYVGNGIEEDKMKDNYFLRPLWDFLLRHQQITLLTGIESYKVYTTKQTKTAKPAGQGFFYDAFNGAVLLDSKGPLSFYHKSMLVPGVETLPWFLKFIDSWFEKFGGTTAGYARQQERTVLKDPKHAFDIAPAICYESIYGEYMSEYIRNGANVICIITNDGWWGNTPGHKQHMNYARLRAIETRKWVIRSANTGISCFIDPNGIVINPQPWDKTAAIERKIAVNDYKTFFVQHGDILSQIMTGISIVLLGWTITLWIRKKFFPVKQPFTQA